MANNGKVDNQEDSNPLLEAHLEVNGTKSDNTDKADNTKTAKKAVAPESGEPEYGWTANGMPLRHGSVMGEPMGRAHWNSSLCDCLGRNDDFCSSDLEVCLLGSVAPCVLYGSNVERLGSVPGTFAYHCFRYTGLYLLGHSFFGWNCLAPLFLSPTRSDIRQKFNLEGSFEALNRSCGCCGSCVEDELQRELFELACDLTTHVCCHPCALCQEGREIRRRLPHPRFSAQPVLVMIPPGEQTMGRGA